MSIRLLPALGDNLMYLLIDKATQQAAIVDPVQPYTVRSRGRGELDMTQSSEEQGG